MDLDHVRSLIDAPPKLTPSKLMQYIKDVRTRKLQQEFINLSKRYWGRHGVVSSEQQDIFVLHWEPNFPQ